MTRLAVAVLAALFLLASCVAPDRTYEPYEADAVSTAEDAASAAQTALLAVDASTRGNVTQNYLSVVLEDAEADASGVQGTFDSIQPPGSEGDKLKDELDKLLDDAASVLEELRITVRRGELEKLPDIAHPLNDTAKKLDDFATEHER
jgi:hypothetical protein